MSEDLINENLDGEKEIKYRKRNFFYPILFTLTRDVLKILYNLKGNFGILCEISDKKVCFMRFCTLVLSINIVNIRILIRLHGR